MLRRNMTHLWHNMIECRCRSIARKREELRIIPTFCVEKCIRFPPGSPFRVLWVETFFRPWSLRKLHKKMKFFIKDFFNKFDQIRRKLRIWSHLLKKSLIETFIFGAVIEVLLINVITNEHWQRLKFTFAQWLHNLVCTFSGILGYLLSDVKLILVTCKWEGWNHIINEIFKEFGTNFHFKKW